MACNWPPQRKQAPMETREEPALPPIVCVEPDYAEAFEDVDLCECADGELVVAVQNGNCRAAGELLMRHRGRMYGAVRRYTANADEADDIVQEATLHAFANIGKFRQEARFSSWLIAIAVNTVLSAKRKSVHYRWVYLDDQQDSHCRSCWLELQDTTPTPECEYRLKELQDLVQREIGKLPRLYRSALRARNCDTAASVEETAHDLGITVAAFKSRLWRARSMLLEALQEHGLFQADTRRSAHGHC
jgi:RNA polymerase sigma-70 factor (ECF subfamily)